jgi:hypothetical protein
VILDQTLFVDIENLSLLFSNSPPSVDNGYWIFHLFEDFLRWF